MPERMKLILIRKLQSADSFFKAVSNIVTGDIIDLVFRIIQPAAARFIIEVFIQLIV